MEDLLQAQKEISAHNRQLKEQTKQLEREMALLRDHSLLLVRPRCLLLCCRNLHGYSIIPVVCTCCHYCCFEFVKQSSKPRFIQCCLVITANVVLFLSLLELFMSRNITVMLVFVILQLKSRCEELKLDWGSLCLESLLKEKQALRRQISEKQRHCLELQVHRPPHDGKLTFKM